MKQNKPQSRNREDFFNCMIAIPNTHVESWIISFIEMCTDATCSINFVHRKTSESEETNILVATPEC